MIKDTGMLMLGCYVYHGFNKCSWYPGTFSTIWADTDVSRSSTTYTYVCDCVDMIIYTYLNLDTNIFWIDTSYTSLRGPTVYFNYVEKGMKLNPAVHSMVNWFQDSEVNFSPCLPSSLNVAVSHCLTDDFQHVPLLPPTQHWVPRSFTCSVIDLFAQLPN